MNRVDIEVLRSLLEYDPGSGVLTWKHRPREMFNSDRIWKTWNSRWAGKEAFTSVTKLGYREGRIFRKGFLAHRVSWALFHGCWSDVYIDHINGDPFDNRIENLREVNNQENLRNSGLYSTNKSGVTGVSFSTDRRKWIADIRVDNKTIPLGRFSSFKDAVCARKQAELEYGFHKNHGSRESLRERVLK